MSHPTLTPAWPFNYGHRIAKEPSQYPSKSKSRRGKSTPGTSGAKDVEVNEDGSAESADEEEESNEDEDPEVFAPSGYANNLKGIQAGPHNCGTIAHNAVYGKNGVYSKSNARGCSLRGSSRSVEALTADSRTDLMTFDSEDEDYNAIDFISESDEEEPNIELLEERAIIEYEELNGSDSSTFAALSPIGSFGDWPDLELPSDGTLPNVSYGDALWPRQSLENDDHEFLTTFVGQALSPSRVPSPHVHFRGDLRRSFSSSDSIISDIDRSLFPDIFMDRFDPKIKDLIENDNEADAQSLVGSESSEWDLEHATNTRSGKSTVKLNRSADRTESLSGYESDEGETTDEEIIPPSTITRPQSLLSLNSSPRPPIMRPPAPTPTRRGIPTPASRRRGPTMGSWIADPTKPIAIIDSTGKHMVIYPAKRTSRPNRIQTNPNASGRSSADTTPRASVTSLSKTVVGSDNERSDISSQGILGPMIGSHTNLMMSGLFHGGPGSEHVLGGQVVGPPEAFYPWKSINANGDIENDLQFEQDPYNMLDTTNYDEFITYDSESESNAEATNQDDTISPTTSTFPTSLSASKPSSSASMSTTQELLQHFDKGIVTAFRQNQSLHTGIMDRTFPSASGSIYGMKTAYASINSALSPLRKRKSSFGQENGGHKRNKGSF